MNSKQFKRVARILKASYKKVEEQARKSGMDLMSKEYEALIDRVRETVLTEMGFTLAEYRKVKAKVDPKSSHEVEMAEHMERSALPFEAEVKEIAESVAKKIIPPPQTLKQIFKYDDSKLKEGLKELSEKVGKAVTQEELHDRVEALKTDILTWNSENFSDNFQKNIDILGMPDFRKLAMGLQAQIDNLSTSSGSGDVVGPASATDSAIVLFDGTTGKLVKDSAVAVTTLAPKASPTFTGTVTLPVGLTGVIRADSGVVSVDSDVTDIVAAGTATAAGKLELATDAETVTGTDTARATTPANITAKMAAPGAIGGTTPGSIVGTTIDANTDFTIGGTVITDNTITDDGTLILNPTTAVSFSDKPITNVGDIALDSLTADATNIDLNSPLQLTENAPIMLDAAGSADGKYSGITISGTAGATLAFGDLVYLAAADSRWELADADSATTADRMLGMCVLAAASDGDPTRLLLMGNIRADAAFPALTIGSPVYVGETAGDVQTAIPTGADNVIRRVGYALTADELYFNPSMDSQITVA